MKIFKRIIAFVVIIITYPFELIICAIQGAAAYAWEFMVDTHEFIKSILMM